MENSPSPKELALCITKCQGKTLQDKVAGIVLATKLLVRLKAAAEVSSELAHVFESFSHKLIPILGFKFLATLLRAPPKSDAAGQLPLLSGYQRLAVNDFFGMLPESAVIAAAQSKEATQGKVTELLDMIGALLALYSHICVYSTPVATGGNEAQRELRTILHVLGRLLKAFESSSPVLYTATAEVILAYAASLLVGANSGELKALSRSTVESSQALIQLVCEDDIVHHPSELQVAALATLLFQVPSAVSSLVELLAGALRPSNGGEYSDITDKGTTYRCTLTFLRNLLTCAALCFDKQRVSEDQVPYPYPSGWALDLRDVVAAFLRRNKRNTTTSTSKSALELNSILLDIVASLLVVYGPALLILPSTAGPAVALTSVRSKAPYTFAYFEAGFTFSTIASIELQLALAEIVGLDRMIAVPEGSQFSDDDLNAMQMPAWVKSLAKSTFNERKSDDAEGSTTIPQTDCITDETKDESPATETTIASTAAAVSGLTVASALLRRAKAASAVIRALSILHLIVESLNYDPQASQSRPYAVLTSGAHVSSDSFCPYIPSLSSFAQQVSDQMERKPMFERASAFLMPSLQWSQLTRQHQTDLIKNSWETRLSAPSPQHHGTNEGSTNELLPTTIFVKIYKMYEQSTSLLADYIVFVFDELPRERLTASRPWFVPLVQVIHVPLLRRVVVTYADWVCSLENDSLDGGPEHKSKETIAIASDDPHMRRMHALCLLLGAVVSVAPGKVVTRIGDMEASGNLSSLMRWDVSRYFDIGDKSTRCHMDYLEVCPRKELAITSEDFLDQQTDDPSNDFWRQVDQIWEQRSVEASQARRKNEAQSSEEVLLAELGKTIPDLATTGQSMPDQTTPKDGLCMPPKHSGIFEWSSPPSKISLGPGTNEEILGDPSALPGNTGVAIAKIISALHHELLTIPFKAHLKVWEHLLSQEPPSFVEHGIKVMYQFTTRTLQAVLTAFRTASLGGQIQEHMSLASNALATMIDLVWSAPSAAASWKELHLDPNPDRLFSDVYELAFVHPLFRNNMEGEADEFMADEFCQLVQILLSLMYLGLLRADDSSTSLVSSECRNMYTLLGRALIFAHFRELRSGVARALTNADIDWSPNPILNSVFLTLNVIQAFVQSSHNKAAASVLSDFILPLRKSLNVAP